MKKIKRKIQNKKSSARKKKLIQSRLSRQVMGIHSCLEVLRARPKKIRTIYVQKNWQANRGLKEIVSQAGRYRIDVCEQSQMASWGKGHQGAALIVEESPCFDFSAKREKSVLIYIDGLEDPRNLGAVIRTAWLMGAEGVFLPTRNSIRKVTAVVSKSACGGSEYVPVEFLANPRQWIQKMKKSGFIVYGLEKKGPHSLWSEKFEKKAILIAGSEDKGLKLKTKSLCDQLIHIPQQCKQGHYNLSVSISLALGSFYAQHYK